VLTPLDQRGVPIDPLPAPLPLLAPTSDPLAPEDVVLNNEGIASAVATACTLGVAGVPPVTIDPLADGATPDAVSSDEMPELIPINCCRLFTSTICVI
jgi:hypothetical protein